MPKILRRWYRMVADFPELRWDLDFKASYMAGAWVAALGKEHGNG